jgi:hypothetical protein
MRLGLRIYAVFFLPQVILTAEANDFSPLAVSPDEKPFVES